MKPVNIKFERAKALQDELIKLYPKTFSRGGKTLPLKIGIFNDLIATESFQTPAERRNLRAALFFYTKSWAYNRAVAKLGARRVDLNGNFVDPVSDEDRAHAIERMISMSKENREKRKLQPETANNHNITSETKMAPKPAANIGTTANKTQKSLPTIAETKEKRPIIRLKKNRSSISTTTTN